MRSHQCAMTFGKISDIKRLTIALMRFTFKIYQMKNGSLEPLLEPSPLDLPSMDAAYELAKHFASYVPAHLTTLITIESEDGSISELWFGDSQDIALAAD
jgi:hypothetical protein